MNKKQDKFTYETIIDTVKRVKKIKPLVVSEVFSKTVYNKVCNKYNEGGHLDHNHLEVVEEIIENAVKSHSEQILSFNSQVAEIQRFLKDRNYLKMLDDATQEERDDIVNTLLEISVKSTEMNEADQKNQKGKKNKIEADLNTLIEKNKKNVTVLTITQSYPTVVGYDGKSEKLQEKLAAEWQNIALSYGIS